MPDTPLTQFACRCWPSHPFWPGPVAALACFLILAERLGKADRSPAKTALLAYAAGPVGLGRGMGVHKALDQLGAVSGPLLVAAVAAVAGALWPALAILIIITGVAALLVLGLGWGVGWATPNPHRMITLKPSAQRPSR